MTTPSSNASAPDRDRTHTVTDGSVRSTGPTDKSVDLDDQAMKSRLQRRMFGGGTTPPRIGKYRIERRVGAGGMGVVYEAYDDELERRVAVKLLHPELDEHHAIRMRREALALAKLSHPNVVHAYEIGLHESSLFLAMEFLAGEQLSKWQRAHRRQWKAVVAKYLDAGRGLAAAHAAGIVHRDFKPSNVVVCEDGTVRVLDFGLARSFGAVVGSEEGGALANMSALDARVTVTGTTMGTPAYMSPEQMLGQPTNAAADQFSFCVSLYEGLYGERPFGGDKAAQVYESVLFERLRPPPKDSSVPLQLRRIVLRGLRPKPEQRYASMADLLRALEGSTATGRWRPVVALGTLSAVPMFWLVAAAGPDCADDGGRAASLWDARRDAVATAISDPELGYGEATMAAVDERVDTYVGQWAAQHASACEIDDESQRRQVLACLDNGLATLDRLAAVLESGGSGVVDQAAELVDELAPPDDCAGASIQSADGDQLAELMSARLDALAGRHEEARRKATSVLEVARSEQARGLAGEAFFTLALVELEAARHEPALDYFRSAAAEGLAADTPLVVADAWIESARLQALEPGTLTASREHSANARALLEGLSASGSIPGDREARLVWVDGMQASTAQDVTLAVTRLREAVAGLVDAHDLRHTLVTKARLDLAHVLAEAGNTREAIETYDDARSAMVELSGPHHPDLWAFDYGIALAHLDLGETENAKARLHAAFEVISDAGSARAEHRGQVLVALSRVYLVAGDNDRALEAARSARRELGALPPDHLVRLGAENTVAVLLQRSGDFDGASEAFRSLAAGLEIAKDQRSAAAIWTQLVTLELYRARPGDASTILERHRDAVRERFGDAMTEALDVATAALRELDAEDAVGARAHLERVRELLSPEGHDAMMWCDVRAWATIMLARSYVDDDPARAKALAEEARSHLAASQHDPTLLAEAEALLHD